MPARQFRLAIFAVFLGVLVLTIALLHRFAYAQAVPDPVATGQAAVDAGWSVVTSYGPIWGVALLLSGGIATFLKKNDTEHWLAQGRRLAVITGVGSVLAALLAWHFKGAPIAGVFVTAVTAIKMIVSPFVTPAPAPSSAAAAPAKAPQGSSVLMALALMLITGIGGGALTSCGSPAVQQVKDEGAAAGRAILDCGKKLGPGQLEVGLVQLLGDAVEHFVPALGEPDWDALAALAIADITELKTCALAEYHAVRAAQQGGSPSAAAVSAFASVTESPDRLAAALARIKAARRVASIVTPGGRS